MRWASQARRWGRCEPSAGNKPQSNLSPDHQADESSCALTGLLALVCSTHVRFAVQNFWHSFASATYSYMGGVGLLRTDPEKTCQPVPERALQHAGARIVGGNLMLDLGWQSVEGCALQPQTIHEASTVLTRRAAGGSNREAARATWASRPRGSCP